MASFFKKKPKKPEEQQSLQPEAGTSPTLLGQPPKPKKRLFGKKGPKEPKAPKVPKPPKVKKSKPPKPPKPIKVKKPKAPKAPKEKKAKAPKEKKAKAPKEPREKKARAKGGGFGGSKSSPVGLDLGRTSITAVQLKYQTGGATLLSAAAGQLPEGLIQEGEVRDVEALSLAIRDFWKTYKIRGRKVNLGLANQKVIVRTLEFPIMDESELKSAIEFQAQDYIPIPIEEAVFDYHIIGRVADAGGIEKQKILVVAAQKEMVMDFINAVKKAKLTVAGVDLQAFAMLRSLAPKSMLEMGPPGGAVAIANIASDVTNLVVSVAGEPQFTRIVSFGGDNFTRAVQEFRGITFSEAEALKTQAGLPKPGERAGGEGKAETENAPEPEDTGKTPAAEGPEEAPPEAAMPEGGEIMEEGETLADVQRVLELTAEALADEIRRSLDYYMSQEQSVPITRLLISGGGALIRNLDLHLAQIFPFEVSMGDPLARITQNNSDLTDEELKALGPRLAIAIGLALENEE